MLSFYVLSCMPTNGVQCYAMNSHGGLAHGATVDLQKPMYAVMRGDIIYLILRAPWGEGKSSAVTALKKDAKGGYAILGEMRACEGVVACHLAVSPDGKYLYTANYLSGSISEFPLCEDGSVAPLRRTIVHPTEENRTPRKHGVFFTPDQRFLCVPDLGLDTIFVHAVSSEGIIEAPCSQYHAMPGDGPRHMVFSSDGSMAYSVNQTTSTVDILRCRDGRLIRMGRVSTFPEGTQAKSIAAAIRLSPGGRFLYASNRGHDSIACFEVVPNGLRWVECIPCHGHNPRDFDLSSDGQWLVCCNMEDNRVASFAVHTETGKLSLCDCQCVPAPLAVLFGGGMGSEKALV